MISGMGRIFISWTGIKNSAVNIGVRKRINRKVMEKFLSMSELVTLLALLNWNKMFNQPFGPTNIDRGEDSAPCRGRKLNYGKGSRFVIVLDNFGSIRSSRGGECDCFFDVLDRGVTQKCMNDQLMVVLPGFYYFKVGIGFEFVFNFSDIR